MRRARAAAAAPSRIGLAIAIGSLGLGLALVFAATQPAHARELRVGVLDCIAGPGGGIIVMTTESLTCTFHPTNGVSQTYIGTVKKFGLDIGITGGTVIAWAVLADQDNYDPQALAGNYVGVSADASIGLGAGANALLGGSSRSFVLQPISVQGEVGVDIALGITDMDLVRA
ncbi:MAG: hypothetical protein JWQ89_956 [Devosia sp.]|uniref:DUF992 domain-containing protein n=1 Tax=Devosia sp. TaxID=1871048 RepID=UPI0026392AE7|nr:DUF992 domain-containing protein [Devosia sp.]MDB5539229.1 hypothetical protein [Devosia sp.]